MTFRNPQRCLPTVAAGPKALPLSGITAACSSRCSAAEKKKKKDALLLLDCCQHAQASTLKTRRHLLHAVRGKDVDYMRNHAQSFCLDWVLIWLQEL